MKRSTAIWLIIAASLILTGSVITGGALAANKWDMKNLSNEEYREKSYEITEEYSDISVLTDTAMVDVIATKEASCRVECVELVKAAHKVEVRNGTLTVEIEDTRKWYEHIGIFFAETPKITVYLPEGEYGALKVRGSTGNVFIQSKLDFKEIGVDVSTGNVECFASAVGKIAIKTTTGNISLGDISAAALELTVNTGSARLVGANVDGELTLRAKSGNSILENVSCGGLSITGTTGDVVMKNVVAEKSICVERSTGDVSFERCDAEELTMTTDTGNIAGSLLTAKTFSVSHTTGKVRLPETQAGGRFTVKSDTGNIIIDVVKK